MRIKRIILCSVPHGNPSNLCNPLSKYYELNELFCAVLRMAIRLISKIRSLKKTLSKNCIFILRVLRWSSRNCLG